MRIEIDMNRLNSTELLIVSEWLRRGIAAEMSMWESIPAAKPKMATPRPMVTKEMECSEKKPRYLNVEVPRKQKGKKFEVQIDKIIELVKSRPGKNFTFPKLFRKFKIANGNWSRVKHTLEHKHGISLSKINNKWQITAKIQKEQTPVLTNHEKPMHQKSEFLKFKSERIKYHMKTNRVGYLAACRLVDAEWKPKKQRQVTAKTFIIECPFPQMESIKLEFLPILRDILSNLINTPNTAMDYNSVAYTLGLKGLEQYHQLTQEILEKTDAIKSYFGIEQETHRFVVENYKVCWK